MPPYSGLVFETCQLIGFLDCKFDETCAPGSGPMMDDGSMGGGRLDTRGGILWLRQSTWHQSINCPLP
jgi:hypothetical protein